MSDLVVPAVIAPQPASFNPGASLVELETQLRTAVACADASDKTAGALILHMVEQRKQTVRSIGNTVGKSAAWVHAMLTWARDDYRDDPFSRSKRVQPAEQADKVVVNGHPMDIGRLGPAAQEQIAEAIGAEAAPEAARCPCPMCDEPHVRLTETWLAVAGEPAAADR